MINDLEEENKYFKKMIDKWSNKLLSEQEIELQEFIVTEIDKSKVSSLIYIVRRNKREGIGFTEEFGKPKATLSPCFDYIKKGLKTYFVSEADKTEVLNKSESKASESQILNKSGSKILKSKALIKPNLKTSKIQIIKRPEPMTSKSQVLMRSESKILKTNVEKSSIPKIKMISRPKEFKPRILNESKSYEFRHKTQSKLKPFRINPKGPIKIWVPKFETINVAYMSKRKGKAEIIVPEQWLLATHDKRKVYVPNPNHERGRKCRVWRKPKRKDYWYRDY